MSDRAVLILVKNQNAIDYEKKKEMSVQVGVQIISKLPRWTEMITFQWWTQNKMCDFNSYLNLELINI